MTAYKVFVTGLKTDEDDDPETPTSVEVEAVGVFPREHWLTFHTTDEDFTYSVVAAFPTNRVVTVERVVS
jgi:hypothetical protein